jgi:hypothetical protein
MPGKSGRIRLTLLQIIIEVHGEVRHGLLSNRENRISVMVLKVLKVLKQFMRASSPRVLPFLVMLLCGVPHANAAEPIAIDNLQAAVQTLNFLDSLPKDGPIAIGVIYAPEVSNAQLLATETSKALSAMRGPNNRDIQTVVMTIDEVSRYAGHLDVIYLLVGVSNHSNVIVNALRRLRAISISDDPACMVAACCVLQVRSGQRVEITLNSALAGAAGARFSLVFMMVVKHT